jgi:hypothetical protein
MALARRGGIVASPRCCPARRELERRRTPLRQSCRALSPEAIPPVADCQYQAFILSKSTTQYRTLDRGRTWQTFETPLPPALNSQPLAFHSKKDKWDWIMFTGQLCESLGGWRGMACQDEVRSSHETTCPFVCAYRFASEKTYVTQDAFQTTPRKLLDNTSRCIWAHSTPQFNAPVADSLVYCIAFDPSSDSSSNFGGFLQGLRNLRDSRLYSSTDFFASERNYVDLGIGKDARGLVGIGGVQKYIVTALKPGSVFADPDRPDVAGDEMILYVTEDGQTWSRALFPHGHGLKENAYTIVESTSHSILVDVLTDTASATGTLFTSNSNGTYFVRALEHTNRNSMGIVDFEKLENVEGVAIANVVGNWEDVQGSQGEKRLKTKITFDDGVFAHAGPRD